jgi:hypothetical protein
MKMKQNRQESEKRRKENEKQNKENFTNDVFTYDDVYAVRSSLRGRDRDRNHSNRGDSR